MGTLKVTCSRLGISLRRPKVKLLPPKTATGTASTVGAAGEIATFTISMKYKGQEHSTALPLTPNMISHLALEASFRDQEIGELAKDILVSVLEKGLIQELLGELRTPEGGVGKVATRPGAVLSPRPHSASGRPLRLRSRGLGRHRLQSHRKRLW